MSERRSRQINTETIISQLLEDADNSSHWLDRIPADAAAARLRDQINQIKKLRAELQQARAEVTERDKLIQSILKGAEIAAGQMGEEIGRLKCLVHAMADSVDWDFDVEDELNELVAGVCKSVEERAGETAPIGNLVGIKDPWVPVEDGLPAIVEGAVLVSSHAGMEFATYGEATTDEGHFKYWCDPYGEDVPGVTHWRRIEGP